MGRITVSKKSFMRTLSWYKAGAIAGLWAAFEIVFGSFFHALRLPFAGSVLTFFSIVLLTAFSRYWQDRNLYIKAGFLAGLLRSVMPFLVIVGPFVGIVTEGLIFQFIAGTVFRYKKAGLYVAGVLIMLSALVHKVVGLLIIYGWDLVRIGEGFIGYLRGQTGWEIDGVSLLYDVIFIYAALGVIAVYTGIKISRDIKFSGISPVRIRRDDIHGGFSENHRFRYRPAVLLILFPVAVFLIIAMERYSPSWFIAVLVFVGVISIRYPHFIRKLLKPVFWLQILMIGIVAWWIGTHHLEPVYQVLRLTGRALVIVGLMSAVSVELHNPVVRKLAEKRRMGGGYRVLQAVSGILPGLLENMNSRGYGLKHPFRLIGNVLEMSFSLLYELVNEDFAAYEVSIIAGERGAGKTHTLKLIFNSMSDVETGGVLLHKEYHTGKTASYRMEILDGKQLYLFASEEDMGNSVSVGRYYVSTDAIEIGNRELKRALGRKKYILLDEIGPLELSGEGWHSFLQTWAIMKNPPVLITAVRISQLEKVIQKYMKDKSIRIIHL